MAQQEPYRPPALARLAGDPGQNDIVDLRGEPRVFPIRQKRLERSPAHDDRRIDRYRQHAALGPSAFWRGCEALRRDLAVFDVEQRPYEDDLAAELALEKFLVVFRHAGMQVGKGIGGDIIGAALEVERKQISWFCRELRNEHVGHQRESAPRELGCHGGHLFAVHVEAHGDAADHIIGIGMDVERTDVASKSDRDALRGGREQRMILVLDLTQHDFAGARGKCQGAEVIAIEAAHLFAQRPVPERDFGLLDRSRENEVESRRPWLP